MAEGPPDRPLPIRCGKRQLVKWQRNSSPKLVDDNFIKIFHFLAFFLTYCISDFYTLIYEID